MTLRKINWIFVITLLCSVDLITAQAKEESAAQGNSCEKLHTICCWPLYRTPLYVATRVESHGNVPPNPSLIPAPLWIREPRSL